MSHELGYDKPIKPKYLEDMVNTELNYQFPESPIEQRRCIAVFMSMGYSHSIKDRREDGVIVLRRPTVVVFVERDGYPIGKPEITEATK